MKRFLQEDYAVKKHNHTCDYTIDICMYLCPISFQGMHKGDSHMHVFLDPQDNNTKHEYYTPQEILDGTEDHIKEMMRTAHKNHTDRHKEEQESGGVPAAKRQKQQSLLNFTVRSGGAAVVSFLEACSQEDPAPDTVDVSMEQVISDEMDTYQCKVWTVRLPDPTRR